MSINDIKVIKMVPDKPYASSCDVKIYDEVNGKDRKRCAIKLEYSKYDIDELKKQGLGYNEIISHYEDWIYRTVRRYLCYEWECESGYDEVIKILEEHIKPQFR